MAQLSSELAKIQQLDPWEVALLKIEDGKIVHACHFSRRNLQLLSPCWSAGRATFPKGAPFPGAGNLIPPAPAPVDAPEHPDGALGGADALLQ